MRPVKQKCVPQTINDTTTTCEDLQERTLSNSACLYSSPIIYAITLNSRVKLIVSLVTTTQAVKQIHVNCFGDRHQREGFVFYFVCFFHMQLDATAGVFLAFLCAFRTLTALQDSHHRFCHTVIISAPNEVSVGLEAIYKTHIVVFRNTRWACRAMCL